MSVLRPAAFPLYSLLSGVVVTMVGIGSLIWFGYDLHTKSRLVVTAVRENTTLVEQVRYYDEVLTMSAGMAAWTAHPSWRQRYDRAAGGLDAVFADIRRVAPPHISARLMAQTSQANDRLIELEARAFQLVEQGAGQEAWSLLQSDDYQREKEVYKAGIEEFIAAFTTYMAQTEARQWRSVQWNTGLGLGGLLLILMSWLAIWRALARFRQENRLFQSNLEQQVSDRTRELQAEIDERRKAQQQLHDAYDVITSSIRYAARIQRAVLPDEAPMTERLSDHFVLWEPRDTVGGDLYWCGPWGDSLLIVLGDCTGHGVPGAFMTLLSIGALERARQEVPDAPLETLISRMHALLQITLGQHQDGGASDDGIELGACLIAPDRSHMTFVGARLSLFRADSQGVEEFKGMKQGLGYRGIPLNQLYEGCTIAIEPGQTFYMTSDGLIDQIGGPKGISFGRSRFVATLRHIQALDMAAQRQALLANLEEYQGDQSRRDDVAVIGFRV